MGWSDSSKGRKGSKTKRRRTEKSFSTRWQHFLSISQSTRDLARDYYGGNREEKRKIIVIYIQEHFPKSSAIGLS
eukprot:3484719-Pleurochrysis_carterae.AAC.1